MTVQSAVYMIGGILLAGFGVWWVVEADPSSVTYATVEGISVFAVLYVIAQAAERVTEWLIDLLSLIPDSPENRKNEALKEVRQANSTLNRNPTLADFGPQLVAGTEGALANAMTAAVQATSQAAAGKKEGEEKVEAARRDIVFLAHGLSFAVCAVAVNALNYGLLRHIGAEGVDGRVDRLFTALAAAGGTKALHELIGRFQKAKESTETAEAKS